MNRLQRIEELFEAALPLEAAARSALLAQAEAEIRIEVDALLAAHAQAQAFFAQPASAEAAQLLAAADDPLPVARIGPYQLIRELGRGGMGAVYLGERADGMFQQQVAIKLIKRGMDTDEILRRFHHERQILAALNHPGIARLLDGGTTAQGVPYFVMEYIVGRPLDSYCGAHELTLAQRLELFREVCAAVQFAHQNLVIHRDLKPGNILVTDNGAPKLLDFGIAKLLKPGTAEATATNLQPLTPAYASPEQLRGEAVTTISDVYSLGVVLYELLTGRRPYALQSATPAELARIVGESDPPKPSQAIQAAVRNSTLPPTALRLLPAFGDLDNIVMMALRKEPARRYASVEQFSEDLRRYLAGLPVQARENTLGYRAIKFMRRHKAGVSAAALVALALVTGLIATVWQARVAQAERARAERRFNDVRQLAHSFLFEFHDGIEKLPGATPMRELLVKRALQYLDSLAREAGQEAGLQNELATAYEKIGAIQSSFGWANKGDTAGALDSYRKALALRENLPLRATAEQLALADVLGKVGQTLIHTHDFPGALAHFQRAQTLLESLPTQEQEQVAARRQLRHILTLKGQVLSEQEQSAQASAVLRQALQLAEADVAQHPVDQAAQRGLMLVLYELGYLLLGTKDNAEAITLLRRNQVLCQKLLSAAPQDPQARRDLALAHDQLGSALYEAGDLAGELENYRASLRLREELAAADPVNVQARSDLATGYYNLGFALAQTGAAAAGVATYQKAIKLIEDAAAANPANARLRARVANFYVYFGKLWETLAMQVRVPRALQRQRWRAARMWYQRALTLTTEMHAQHLATGASLSTPEQIAAHLYRCEMALATK